MIKYKKKRFAFTSYQQTFLLFFITLFVCIACSEREKQIELNPKYSEIQNIVSIAQCKGPGGNYVTEVTSFEDGGGLFTQKYDYQKNFYSRINSDSTGYVLSEQGDTLQALPRNAVEVIRSHEFHRLHINPNHFFHEFKYINNENDLEVYNALDRLNRTAKIYYSRKEKLIEKVELTNPLDTLQTIEIQHKKWMDTEYGKMVKELEIVQAKKDTFYFNFENIQINTLKNEI